MDTPTIIALIASIGAVISGIAATISCVFTYKTTQPNLKVEIEKDKCVYMHNDQKSFALMPFEVRNSAMVGGMIDEICILHNGKKYYAEDKYTDFDPYPFEIRNTVDDKIERDVHQLRLKCPIQVNGFSVVQGFIFFPSFPAVQTANISVTISYRLMNKNRKKKFRKITFSFVNPTPIYPRQKHTR